MQWPVVSRKRFERVLQEQDYDLHMMRQFKSFVEDLLTREEPSERHCRDTMRRIDGALRRPGVLETQGERSRLRLKREWRNNSRRERITKERLALTRKNHA